MIPLASSQAHHRRRRPNKFPRDICQPHHIVLIVSSENFVGLVGAIVRGVQVSMKLIFIVSGPFPSSVSWLTGCP
jgi:hypothetical protein